MPRWRAPRAPDQSSAANWEKGRIEIALGSMDMQKMASRKWQVFATRSAACFLHVSTGSAGSCHLQAARAECRSILAHVYHLAQRADASHMRLMLIATESTPNPATLQFLPGRPDMEEIGRAACRERVWQSV